MLILLWSQAHALSCVPPGFTGTAVGDGVVPIDGELVVFYNTWQTPQDLVLLQGDTFLDVSVDPVAGGVAAVRPSAPLEVGSTYNLFGVLFEVEAVVDTEPPAPPSVLDVRVFNRRNFDGNGRVQGMAVQTSGLDDDASWLEVELSAAGDFTDAVRFGSDTPTMSLGRFDCMETWPDYDESARYAVRARQVDLMGNRSDWSEAVEARGCGCSSAGRGVWGMWVGLLAFALRYRR